MVMSDAARANPEIDAALAPGTRLREFEIRRQLGAGGFGIVYLAFDHALEREVAIKEYMPASMAGRTQAMHVSLRSRSDAEVFALGLRSFINEAKLLARFDHPSLIKVHQFWEANNTAYMVMPVLRGQTLKEIRRDAGRGPDEAWVRDILTPLLGALEQLHNEGVYHRDISPDNIHLEAESRPVLLDFGAARRVISGKTQTLTAILKPAYAPIEQYGEAGGVKQGPWTDLYALGATLHYMLLGHPPAPATARTVGNESSELLRHNVPNCSPHLLATIDWMLAPRPADRPQSVAEVRAVLEGKAALPRRPGASPPAASFGLPADPVVTVPLADTAQAAAEAVISALDPHPPAARGTGGDVRRGGATGAGATDALRADGTHRLRPPPARARWMPLALVGLVLTALLGYLGWSRLGLPGTPGAASAAPPSSAAARDARDSRDARDVPMPPVASTPAPGVDAAAPAPMPAPVPVAASSGVPAAAAGPAASGAALGAPGPEAPAQAAPVAVATPTRRPLPLEAAASAARLPAGGSLGSAAGPAAGRPPVHSAQPGATAEPGPAVRLPPLRVQRQAPLAASPDGEDSQGASPGARCGGRTPVSHDFCMERECQRPRFRFHPECVVWRARARSRDGAPGS